MRPPLPSWGSPPAQLAMEPGGVHLWRVQLANDESNHPQPLLLSLLSADELARAERLRVPEKARAFIVGRAHLRQILARYLDRAPLDLTFTYGSHGKPTLAGYGDHLQFNLAHSDTWMLLAVTAGAPVGVDLERLDPALDFTPLASRYFSSAEQELLAQAPPSRRRRTFYRLWTRKEAYLKGRGGGFSENLGEDVASSGWHAWNFFIRRGYVGALAVRGEEIDDIRRWTWGD